MATERNGSCQKAMRKVDLDELEWRASDERGRASYFLS